MYESPRVKLNIGAHLSGNIPNPRWILLISSLIEYRSTFLTTQCYPELQRKTFSTLCASPLSNIHSFLNLLTTLTCIWRRQPCNPITTLKVSSASLYSLTRGYIHHILSTFLIIYSSFATLNLMFQTLRPSRSGPY